MEHGDHSSPEVGLFLRDIHGHVLQAIETIEMLRETLAGILDLHMSGIGNRSNEVMKTLTLFAAIFIPLTFVVGLYGMNFKYMPELESRWGYPGVLVVMVLIAAGIVGYFRRRNWL
jgi:magnesium transporter